MPNKALFAKDAKAAVSELCKSDINVPDDHYQEKSLGLQPTIIFRYSDIEQLF